MDENQLCHYFVLSKVFNKNSLNALKLSLAVFMNLFLIMRLIPMIREREREHFKNCLFMGLSV